MKIKNTLLAILVLTSGIPSLLQAQIVSSTIPTTLSANLTIGDEGKIRATITQNVTQPPATIGFNDLAFNSQPVVFTTANATGHTNVWRGNVSLLSNGTFTGNGIVDSYSNTGNKSSASFTVNSTASRITSSSNNTTISRSNLRSENWGSYQNGDDFDVVAEYPVDVCINFTNGFTLRGKAIRTIKYTHNMSQANEGNDYSKDNLMDWSLIVTGPGGHIGNVNLHFD